MPMYATGGCVCDMRVGDRSLSVMRMFRRGSAECRAAQSGPSAQPVFAHSREQQKVPGIEQVGPASYRRNADLQRLAQQPETEQRGQGAAENHRPGKEIG